MERRAWSDRAFALVNATVRAASAAMSKTNRFIHTLRVVGAVQYGAGRGAVLFRDVDLGLLELPGVVDVERLPLGEDVQRGLARLAMPVPCLLHPAEREVHLGADRAGVYVGDPCLEIAHCPEGPVHVAGEDRGRKPEADAVRDPDRLVEVLDGDQRGGRPEDLLLSDSHTGLDVGEDRRAVVEAVLEAVAGRYLAAGEQLRALVPTDARVGVDLLQRALVDHGPDIGVRLPAWTEPHPLRGGDELGLKLAVDLFVHDHAAGGRAALPRGAEGGPDDPLGREVEVRVVEDEHRILA